MAGLLAVLAVISLGSSFDSSGEPRHPSARDWGQIPAVSAARTDSVARRGPRLGRSVPVELRIGSISLRTGLLRLGLNPDRSLQVPSRPSRAGWFTGSPTPGETGPAVIAGHVDSDSGPAVFYRLGEVGRGDAITITRANDTIADFVVDAVRSYAKSEFPTAAVYGNTRRASLRLITCGGWNGDTREYDANIIVFAHLVATSRRVS